MSKRESVRGRDGTISLLASWEAMSERKQLEQRPPNTPVSQICALSVFPSTLIERVANSTPIVDFVSRLNSFRVNRESTSHER
jgi:hypothetical protein